MRIKSLSCLLYVKGLFIVDSVTGSAFVLCAYVPYFLSAQILMNVKVQTPASMSVKIPMGATSVSVHLAIGSCSMARHVKVRKLGHLLLQLNLEPI